MTNYHHGVILSAVDKQFVFVYIQSQNVAAALCAASDMPEEVFETPQPNEPKTTNWPKIVLAAVLGLALLAGAAYAGYWYGAESAKSQNEEGITTPTPTSTTTGFSASWKTYKNTAYGFELKYPERLRVKEHIYTEIEDGVGEGYAYCLDFEKDAGVGSLPVPQALAVSGIVGCFFEEFGIGAVSVDFEAGREGGFTDTRGYGIDGGRVIFKFAGEKYGKEYEIPQRLVRRVYTNPNGVEIVIVEGADSEEAPHYPIMGTPGDGWLGALINTKHPILTGLAIAYSKTTSLLSEEDFYQILSTFKFLY